MRMKTMTKVRNLLLALGAALFLAGCGKDAERDPYDERYSRMHDPEYLAILDQQRQEQRTTMKKVEVTRRAYAEAVKADPESAKTKTLRKQLDDLQQQLEFQRKVANEIVRQRMLMEERAVDAKSAKQNVKKGK